MGLIGKHVVRWTQTTTAVSTACNATRNSAAQAAEDVLHIDNTVGFRTISRPCCRHPLPRVTSCLFHNDNPRHRRVTAHSHCTILRLGVLLDSWAPVQTG